jgi:integrase
VAGLSRIDGGYLVSVIDAAGVRRFFRLAGVFREQAETFRAHVAALRRAIITGSPLPPATEAWLASLPESYRARLRACGLAPQAVARGDLTISQLVERYIADRPDAAAGTITNLRWAGELATGVLGDVQIGQINEADGQRLLSTLRMRFAEATAVRVVKRLREFLGAAVKAKVLAENSLGSMRLPHVSNRTRDHYISADDAARVLAACPDGRWRLLFALARWGGLRVPSEAFGLTWADVNWAEGRMKVHSPKTARHESGERLVPIFGELGPHLQRAFDDAPAGELKVLGAMACIRSGNVRTQMGRIIEQAGLAAWPKIFQNLRATRATELRRIGFPAETVNAWLGHAQAIAEQHYVQIAPADWQRAAALAASATPAQHLQSPPAAGAQRGRNTQPGKQRNLPAVGGNSRHAANEPNPRPQRQKHKKGRPE